MISDICGRIANCATGLDWRRGAFRRNTHMVTRLITAAIGVAVTLIVLFLHNTAVLPIAAGAISVIALYEYLRANGLLRYHLSSAAALIYALGASHRPLTVPGAEAGVSFCAVCDGAFYAGKTVAVIGGGDSALGDALTLSGIARTVYLIHRRTQFRANAALQE